MHEHTPDYERVGCYTVASMGEGQQLCALLGGQLVNMDKAAPLTGSLPQATAWGLFGPTVIVDALGKRFAREDDANAAAGMGVSPDVLNATFDRYNGFVKDGKDGDFGRTLFLEELEGPYYALKQLPQRYRSNGGVKTNQSGQVLSVVGAVIPNVYCCGAAAGQSGRRRTRRRRCCEASF